MMVQNLKKEKLFRTNRLCLCSTILAYLAKVRLHKFKKLANIVFSKQRKTFSCELISRPHDGLGHSAGVVAEGGALNHSTLPPPHVMTLALTKNGPG